MSPGLSLPRLAVSLWLMHRVIPWPFGLNSGAMIATRIVLDRAYGAFDVGYSSDEIRAQPLFVVGPGG